MYVRKKEGGESFFTEIVYVHVQVWQMFFLMNVVWCLKLCCQAKDFLRLILP